MPLYLAFALDRVNAIAWPHLPFGPHQAPVSGSAVAVVAAPAVSAAQSRVMTKHFCLIVISTNYAYVAPKATGRSQVAGSEALWPRLWVK